MAEALAIMRCCPVPSPRRPRLGRGENDSPASHFELHNPAADRRDLERLAQWCCQFSPTVGLEDADAPETLLLDATNLGPLYGGEDALVRQVARACQRRGLEARLAVADTIGAAWALAHYGDCRSFRALAPLPAAALRLPADLLATLADLGLERVGELLALPRDQLRSRLGPLVLTRIDQALGRAGEVFFPVDPPPDFTVEHVYEFPVATAEAIGYTTERLLKRLSLLLVARSAGRCGCAAGWIAKERRRSPSSSTCSSRPPAGGTCWKSWICIWSACVCGHRPWPSRCACCGTVRLLNGKAGCSTKSARWEIRASSPGWSIGSPGGWEARRWCDARWYMKRSRSWPIGRSRSPAGCPIR